MPPFLPKSGGYRNLRAYQLSEAIHDLTAIFVQRFIPRTSRTADQMVQAARSGKQNIAEGSAASATSKETEIKLTNVAKASLEELLLDYEDYLRQHNLALWGKEHHRTNRLRLFLRSEDFSGTYVSLAQRLDAESYCNLCITLINQATYLLRKLLERQQQQFIEHGGIKELMFKARIDYRNRTCRTSQTSQPVRQLPRIEMDMRRHKGILFAMMFGLTSLGVSAQSYDEPVASAKPLTYSSDTANAILVELLMQRMQLFPFDLGLHVGLQRTPVVAFITTKSGDDLNKRHRKAGVRDVIYHKTPDFRFTQEKSANLWQTVGFIGVGIARTMINPNAPPMPDL